MSSWTIALLHYSCPPVVGGVEEVVRQQALLFRRRFHNVKVFAGAGRFDQRFPVEINPLLGSRNERVLAAQERLLRCGDREPLDSLAEEIRAYLAEALAGFDVVIAHNVLSMAYNLPLTMALRRLARQQAAAVISWNHDSPYFYPGYPQYLDRPPWDALRQLEPGIHYVAVSESRRQEFSRLYGLDDPADRITVVPNGIDPISFFRIDPATARLIQEERLFESDFLMVQPSRLHPRKNVELSIRVVRALQDRGVRARLLVTGPYDPHEAGSVRYAEELRALAAELQVADDVLLMVAYTFRSGERLVADRITIRDLYLIADVLFLPSRQEGFGIPLLESGMIKLPVICSDIPPFREIGGRDVCLFSLEEPPAAIAGRIMEFVARLEPHRLYRRVIQEYAWDNLYASRLEPLLESVVARRAAAWDRKGN